MGKLHCIDVGCGDTSIIVNNENYFLIDCHKSDNLYGNLPTTKIIHGLFITHHHYDHFNGLEYLVNNNFKINYFILCPYKRRRNDNSVDRDEYLELEGYADHFEKQGSKVYRPHRQQDFTKPWWDTLGLKVWMFGPSEHISTSDTRELHDASLVFQIKMGDRRCLFTGDGSDASLNWISENTSHICGDILHASHHGSINGADLEFIKSCNAQHTVISTKSGVHESVPHPTALKRYKDNTKNKVYRTDVSGTITWTFSSE